MQHQKSPLARSLPQNVLIVYNDGFDNSGGHIKIINGDVNKIEANKAWDFTKCETMGGNPIQLWDVGNVCTSVTRSK